MPHAKDTAHILDAVSVPLHGGRGETASRRKVVVWRWQHSHGRGELPPNGAKSIDCVRRTREKMPAHDMEVEALQEV